MRPSQVRLVRRLVLTVLAASAVLVAGLAFPLYGCDGAAAGVTGPVRIATGGTSAVYYHYGEAYRDVLHRLLPDTQPSVLATAASAANVSMVEHGTAEVGFTQADIVTQARPGTLAALARIYDDCLHLVVLDDSPVTALPDLRGRAVAIGEERSGTAITATRLLTVAGLDPTRDLTVTRTGLDASIAALLDRSVEAFFFSGGLPVGPIAQLAAAHRIRLIDLRRYVAPLRHAFGDHYLERMVPGSTYHTAPVVTVGIPNYLVVSSGMSRAKARALTWALFAGRDHIAAAHPVGASLGQRTAIGTPPLPLHPGAASYYRSVKV